MRRWHGYDGVSSSIKNAYAHKGFLSREEGGGAIHTHLLDVPGT